MAFPTNTAKWPPLFEMMGVQRGMRLVYHGMQRSHIQCCAANKCWYTGSMDTHQHTEHPSATDPGQEPIAMRQEDFDNLLAYAENPEKFENFPWRDSLAPLIKTFEEARLAGTPSPRENIARGASLSKDLVVNPQWRDTIRDAIRASSEQSSNTKVLAQVVGEGNRAKEVADVLGLETSAVQEYFQWATQSPVPAGIETIPKDGANFGM